MTLLKRLREGKDEVDDYISSMLPPHGSLPAGSMLRKQDFFGELITLTKRWELQKLQLERGVLGGPVKGEPEPLSKRYEQGSLNEALALYAEFRHMRRALAPRLIRQLTARNEHLMKKWSFRQGGNPIHQDPVASALHDLAITEDLVVSQSFNHDQVRIFIETVCPKRAR